MILVRNRTPRLMSFAVFVSVMSLAAVLFAARPALAFDGLMVINRQTNECLTVGDASNGPFYAGQNVRIWTCIGVSG